jgi:hypothetical protein
MEQYSFSFYCDDAWSFSTLLSRALRSGAETLETDSTVEPGGAPANVLTIRGLEQDAADPRQLSLLT